jgi:peptide/nickel transport system permease protein
VSLKRLFFGKNIDALDEALGDKVEFQELTAPSTTRQIIRIILRDPLAVFALTIIALLLLMAIAAPFIAPFPDQGAGKTDAANRLLDPSSKNVLGTDNLGRDILSRVIYGARPALIAAGLVVSLAITIGTPLGAIAGYYGGWIDEIIMRTTDLFLAFPSLLLAMAIVALLGPSLNNAIIALVVSWWPWYTRLVRSVTLTLRDSYFVEAARSMAIPNRVIIWRHILPNVLTPIIVQATIDIGTVILAATSLAFLGLSAQPPSADWGLMIEDGRQYLRTHWWFSTAPGVAIFLTVLAFNLVGDTLRDIFDPRQYR